MTAVEHARAGGRGALRRPVEHSRASRDGSERALVVDRGPAADAAQQPRPRGRRAARGARRLRRLGKGGAEPRGAAGDRPLAAHARRRRDAARPERQACRRLAHSSRRAARPDRERAARSALGDLGRVPAARGRGADDVRPDDRRELDLHRDAGDPAGHVPDVRGRRRAALRVGRSQRADDPHRRTRRHGRRAAARGDDGGCGDPVRRGRPDPDRAPAGNGVSRPVDGVARRGSCSWSGRGRRRAAALGRACSATLPTSCPSSSRRGARSISSPTRPRRTIRSRATSRPGSRSRTPPSCARATRTSTSAGLASRSPGTSRRCSSTSEPGAMFSIMATIFAGRPMRPA